MKDWGFVKIAPRKRLQSKRTTRLAGPGRSFWEDTDFDGDGEHFYRIQVKTVAAKNEKHLVEKMWKDESHINAVVYFARNSNWGIVAPAFTEEKRPINHLEHFRFQSDSKNQFLAAFHKI